VCPLKLLLILQLNLKITSHAACKHAVAVDRGERGAAMAGVSTPLTLRLFQSLPRAWRAGRGWVLLCFLVFMCVCLFFHRGAKTACRERTVGVGFCRGLAMLCCCAVRCFYVFARFAAPRGAKLKQPVPREEKDRHRLYESL